MQFNKDTFILNRTGDDDSEGQDFFPLFSQQEEDEINKQPVPESLPILPIRNTVLFPGVVFPITVGRDKSIKLIKEANKGDKTIGVFAQTNPDTEEPGFEDLNKVGTLAYIVKMLRMPDGNTTVIIQGKRRIELVEAISTDPYLTAKVKPASSKEGKSDKELKAMISSIKDLALKNIDLSPNIPSEAGFAVRNIDSLSFMVNFIASNLNIPVSEKQNILNAPTLKERSNLVFEQLVKENQMLMLKDQIQSKVRVDIDKQQREYFLHQQMRAIQEELGQDSPDKEIMNLRELGKKKKWSKAVNEAFNKELDKLQRINPASPDYSVSLNYAQLILELPWNELTKDNFDLVKAQKVLDKDHFGLEKVKQRILEYLAVLKLKGDLKSPIICLYGPPGVGKTSLGKSIAKALGRKYIRVSLGGLHDESEIRGHRKTYIGAMPGRIIQNLKKVKSANPVFVLDEIDKVGNDFRGDPSSALLEVLDPEQNTTFHDNYLEIDYDLSKVMFIATANNIDNIQPALLDRMEIIEISGYTVEEKIQIAQKYLIPKQREMHGLKPGQFKLSDSVIEGLIEQYTRESGVRNLEKRIAALVRFNAMQVATDKTTDPNLSKEEVERILGAEKMEKEIYQDNDTAGVVTGLAWSPSGGSILFVESTLTKGKGKVTLTGQLGDVMKESATTAHTFLKANAEYLNIDYRIFDQWDIHMHFPAGSIPKDGPSAGITILTSLASLFTQRKVKSHMAMTGEITLRGRVLPVGGIKEKILAAKRAGIKDIIMCHENKKDVDDIPKDYLKGLTFHYVKNMLEVIDIALLNEKVLRPIDLIYREEKGHSQNI
ncbi:MAG: endopeptidase La [Bacteroidia bacterium]|nr:endopeptidase La [Bacteroidia bacterium]